jgi:hypothetical protein
MNLRRRLRNLRRDRRHGRQHERHGDRRDLHDRRDARKSAEPALIEPLTTDTTRFEPDDIVSMNSSDDNAPEREFELAVQRAAEAFASSIGRPWAATLVADKLRLVADLDLTLRIDATAGER